MCENIHSRNITGKKMAEFVSYKNHFLIAAPNMKDPTFEGTVVYICEHTKSGAMGLVINRPIHLSVESLLERIGIENKNPALKDCYLYDGGPVQVERGFVLHTASRKYHSTMQVTEGIYLSTSRDVLEAVAVNEDAPEKFLLSLGYSGWSDGQLESELAVSGWLIAPADESIIFDTPVDERYEKALKLLGIDLSTLEAWGNEAGHA